ncbi:MAG: orotate phosphoribosyltransferase related protein [uncultured archaeon A07HB70]|jgi:Orotate phosphoribosyltransferase homologs|nr:MAG: orotate phosphoribosyltransferase related protein [uncultured archaeon A07HB70]
MKNVDDLIASAGQLAERGLSRGEIADELNVSRETASWLVERSDTGRTVAAEPDDGREASGPDDIHVDWSTIGRDSARLGHVAEAMSDLLSKQGDAVDLTVGIEKAGAPLATSVAYGIDTDLATYTPAKHQWDDGDMDDLGGSFSRNFATIRGRDCYIVDDTITSGTTMRETVEAIRAEGGNPVACCVVVDKQGVESIDGVPVYSLITVVRVGDD